MNKNVYIWMSRMFKYEQANYKPNSIENNPDDYNTARKTVKKIIMHFLKEKEEEYKKLAE